MIRRLKEKWNVTLGRLILILMTFAIGGSLTGILGKKIMTLLGIHSTAIYIPVYIIIITLIWPMMVLIVSIPLGQFLFFREYLRKMGKRVRGVGK